MHDPWNNYKTQPSSTPLTKKSSEKTATDEFLSTSFIRATFDKNPSEGLKVLFLRYYKPLCSHAMRFVHCKQVSEDLVSEVFFQFYRTKAYLNISSSYVSYLFRAVRNECYSYLKKRLREVDSVEASTEFAQLVHGVQPDEELHYKNLFFKLEQVIDMLPKQCRKVFLLSRFENKKYHQIAEECGISPKTVEIHMSKALRHLRLELNGGWLLATVFCLLSIQTNALYY